MANGGIIGPVNSTSKKIKKTIRTFSATGTFTTTPEATSLKVCSAAGGGGGSGDKGGGGGAGGLKYFTDQPVCGNTPYTVTIGAGGTGSPSPAGPLLGTDGTNTTFGSVTQVCGGGRGGATGDTAGNPGGSGGGGGFHDAGGPYPGSPGVCGQGNAGGASNNVASPGACGSGSGGGGGAGGAGGNAPASKPNSVAGAGGAGKTLTPGAHPLLRQFGGATTPNQPGGLLTVVAGGGGGGADFNDQSPTTGGGGAGGGTNPSPTSCFANGRAGTPGTALSAGGGGGGGGSAQGGNGGSGFLIAECSAGSGPGATGVFKMQEQYEARLNNTWPAPLFGGVNILTIAGGGGGAQQRGGGGGAGGYQFNTNLELGSNTDYSVTVGS